VGVYIYFIEDSSLPTLFCWILVSALYAWHGLQIAKEKVGCVLSSSDIVATMGVAKE